MKYRVIGIYKHEEVVDTESFFYKHWRSSWRGERHQDEKLAVESFAEDMLNFQIIDDEGHGNLSAGSLEWTIEQID